MVIRSGTGQVEDSCATASLLQTLAARREVKHFRFRHSKPDLPPELLILNRFGIGRPYLEAALDISRKYETSPFEVLVNSGIISPEIWFSAQEILARQRQDSVVDEIDRRYLLRNAISGLNTLHPAYSAKNTFIPEQLIWLSLFASALFVAAIVKLELAIVLTILAMTLFYAAAIILRALLLSDYSKTERAARAPVIMAGEYLPTYTVLVALYKEGNQVRQLCQHLAALDWPSSKLDIKLVCESDDIDTIFRIHDEKLPNHFKIVLVPPAEPRTKPKALNYALPTAKGDYLVLYDAEDRPDPGQLREAYVRFLTSPPELACLQAPLTIHNHGENWLCRMFHIEYITLFRGILPVLAKWNAPMPLGGTSNHFKTGILRKVGGWDPYNVTEDADLGIRLHREGYRTGTLTLETLEEAPPVFDIWLKQRTRWIKGWMQTTLVHCRDRSLLEKQLGLPNVLVFHLVMTSIVVSALVHPFFLGLAIYQLAGLQLSASDSLNAFILGTSVFNLVGAYTTYGFLAFIVMKTHALNWRFFPFLLTLPVYWCLVSIAAWRALLHLLMMPHKWEKTPHGLSCHKNGTNL